LKISENQGFLGGKISPNYQKSNLFGFVPPKTSLYNEANRGDMGKKKPLVNMKGGEDVFIMKSIICLYKRYGMI